MIELLTSKKITDENQLKLFQINKHLMQCKICCENYRELVELYDIVESWSIPDQYKVEQELQHMKACRALLRAQKKSSPSLANKIDGWLKNFLYSSKIAIKIRDGIEMTAERASMFIKETAQMNFGFATAQSATRSSETDTSLLIDEKNTSNTIKIEGKNKKQKIKVSLDAVSDTSPLIAVIPHDPELAAAVVELKFDKKQKIWTGEIDKLKEGEYDLLIEPTKNTNGE